MKRQNKGEKQRKSSTWSDARHGGFPDKICVQAVKLNTRTKCPCRLYNGRRKKSLV